VIIRASKEQIRVMTHEEGTRWPFAGKGARDPGPFHLLRQRPKESNEFGKLFETDLSDNRQLQDLGISISFANITQVDIPYVGGTISLCLPCMYICLKPNNKLRLFFMKGLYAYSILQFKGNKGSSGAKWARLL